MTQIPLLCMYMYTTHTMYLSCTNTYTFTCIKTNHMEGPLGHKNLKLVQFQIVKLTIMFKFLQTSHQVQYKITYSVAKDNITILFLSRLTIQFFFKTKYIYKGIHQSFSEIGFQYIYSCNCSGESLMGICSLVCSKFGTCSFEICQS